MTLNIKPDELKNDIEKVLNYFDKNACDVQIIADDGSQILNSDVEKKWFKDNVAFVFSKGCIFNEDDEVNMKKVLSVFVNNNSSRFLDNMYEIRNYDDAMVQRIENQLAIGNGNYHVLLVLIVLKGADVSKAPEEKYNRLGLVRKYVNWEDINVLMTDSLTKYGLISVPKISSSKTRSKNNPTVPRELAFKYDYVIDPDEEDSIRWHQQVETISELKQTYPDRVRNTKTQRSSVGSNSNRSRMMKHPSLQTRINDKTIIPHDSVIDNSFNSLGAKVPSKENQIEFKYEMRKAPPSVKRQDYQLFEYPEEFQMENVKKEDVNGTQVSSNMDVRQYLPTFQQTDIRSSKNRKTATNVSLSGIQNKFN